MCNIKVSDLNSPGKRETERGLFSSPELCVYDEMLVLVRVEGLARVCTPGTVHAGTGRVPPDRPSPCPAPWGEAEMATAGIVPSEDKKDKEEMG